VFLDPGSARLKPLVRDDGVVPSPVRAPGSKVTSAVAMRAGSGGLNSGSMRTLPVKYSVEPFPEGWEPLLLMSMVVSCFALSPLARAASDGQRSRVGRLCGEAATVS
jgi:hypothetical protein